jgi:chromosome segregation ATPase
MEGAKAQGDGDLDRIRGILFGKDLAAVRQAIDGLQKELKALQDRVQELSGTVRAENDRLQSELTKREDLAQMFADVASQLQQAAAKVKG